MLRELMIVETFLFVLFRFSGLMVTAPVLGSSNVPAMAKVGIAGLAALIVTPLLPSPALPLADDTLAFTFIALQELLIGMIIGFVMTLLFAAIQMAGEIMDMLAGFSMVNVFNASLETQVPVLGFFYYLLAMLYFLVMNGHHTMLLALVSSFDKIPIGGLDLRPERLVDQLVRWGSAIFVDGFLIAAPVAGALLLAYITMGLLGRVVPQIHLFVVGFPITISIALGMVALSISVYLAVLGGMFERMFRNVETLIGQMS